MKKKLSRREFIRKTSRAGVAAGLGGCILVPGCKTGDKPPAVPAKDFDLVVHGGHVFDGLGNEPQEADVGVSRGRIAHLGKIDPVKGKLVIEAKGLAVCPGFVDVHNHTDVHLLVEPRAESCIRQGITTVVGGNCGFTLFPVCEAVEEELRENLKDEHSIELTWHDMDGFLARVAKQGMALNYATLLGQGAVRAVGVGLDDRPPTPDELEAMKRMVAEHMQKGAFGLSTGLAYAPGSFAGTAELIELCKVAARFGGVYTTHMRSEGQRLLESLDESIRVAREARIALQISHLKTANPPNWSKVDAALARIDTASHQGIDIHADRYPYVASSTGLSTYFPLWTRQGTTEDFLKRLQSPALEGKLREALARRQKVLGWDQVIISYVHTERNKRFEGKTVVEGAGLAGKEPFDFIRDLLVEEKGRVGRIAFMMTEPNLKKILAHPLVAVASDGAALAPYGILSKGKPHPRSYGTFPRALGRYARDEKVVSLPRMIRKMTSLPATTFGIHGRGVLRPGAFADIVVFDPDRVSDRATWDDPHQYPAGIEHVLVAGIPVVRQGEHTGRLPGRIVRKSGSAG